MSFLKNLISKDSSRISLSVILEPWNSIWKDKKNPFFFTITSLIPFGMMMESDMSINNKLDFMSEYKKNPKNNISDTDYFQLLKKSKKMVDANKIYVGIREILHLGLDAREIFRLMKITNSSCKWSREAYSIILPRDFDVYFFMDLLKSVFISKKQAEDAGRNFTDILREAEIHDRSLSVPPKIFKIRGNDNMVFFSKNCNSSFLEETYRNGKIFHFIETVYNKHLKKYPESTLNKVSKILKDAITEQILPIKKEEAIVEAIYEKLGEFAQGTGNEKLTEVLLKIFLKPETVGRKFIHEAILKIWEGVENKKPFQDLLQKNVRTNLKTALLSISDMSPDIIRLFGDVYRESGDDQVIKQILSFIAEKRVPRVAQSCMEAIGTISKGTGNKTLVDKLMTLLKYLRIRGWLCEETQKNNVRCISRAELEHRGFSSDIFEGLSELSGFQKISEHVIKVPEKNKLGEVLAKFDTGVWLSLRRLTADIKIFFIEALKALDKGKWSLNKIGVFLKNMEKHYKNSPRTLYSIVDNEEELDASMLPFIESLAFLSVDHENNDNYVAQKDIELMIKEVIKAIGHISQGKWDPQLGQKLIDIKLNFLMMENDFLEAFKKMLKPKNVDAIPQILSICGNNKNKKFYNIISEVWKATGNETVTNMIFEDIIFARTSSKIELLLEALADVNEGKGLSLKDRQNLFELKMSLSYDNKSYVKALTKIFKGTGNVQVIHEVKNVARDRMSQTDMVNLIKDIVNGSSLQIYDLDLLDELTNSEKLEMVSPAIPITSVISDNVPITFLDRQSMFSQDFFETYFKGSSSKTMLVISDDMCQQYPILEKVRDIWGNDPKFEDYDIMESHLLDDPWDAFPELSQYIDANTPTTLIIPLFGVLNKEERAALTKRAQLLLKKHPYLKIVCLEWEQTIKEYEERELLVSELRDLMSSVNPHMLRAIADSAEELNIIQTEENNKRYIWTIDTKEPYIGQFSINFHPNNKDSLFGDGVYLHNGSLKYKHRTKQQEKKNFEEIDTEISYIPTDIFSRLKIFKEVLSKKILLYRKKYTSQVDIEYKGLLSKIKKMMANVDKTTISKLSHGGEEYMTVFPESNQHVLRLWRENSSYPGQVEIHNTKSNIFLFYFKNKLTYKAPQFSYIQVNDEGLLSEDILKKIKAFGEILENGLQSLNLRRFQGVENIELDEKQEAVSPQTLDQILYKIMLTSPKGTKDLEYGWRLYNDNSKDRKYVIMENKTLGILFYADKMRENDSLFYQRNKKDKWNSVDENQEHPYQEIKEALVSLIDHMGYPNKTLTSEMFLFQKNRPDASEILKLWNDKKLLSSIIRDRYDQDIVSEDKVKTLCQLFPITRDHFDKIDKKSAVSATLLRPKNKNEGVKLFEQHTSLGGIGVMINLPKRKDVPVYPIKHAKNSSLFEQSELEKMTEMRESNGLDELCVKDYTGFKQIPHDSKWNNDFTLTSLKNFRENIDKNTKLNELRIYNMRHDDLIGPMINLHTWTALALMNKDRASNILFNNNLVIFDISSGVFKALFPHTYQEIFQKFQSVIADAKVSMKLLQKKKKELKAVFNDDFARVWKFLMEKANEQAKVRAIEICENLKKPPFSFTEKDGWNIIIPKNIHRYDKHLKDIFFLDEYKIFTEEFRKPLLSTLTKKIIKKVLYDMKEYMDKDKKEKPLIMYSPDDNKIYIPDLYFVQDFSVFVAPDKFEDNTRKKLYQIPSIARANFLNDNPNKIFLPTKLMFKEVQEVFPKNTEKVWTIIAKTYFNPVAQYKTNTKGNPIYHLDFSKNNFKHYSISNIFHNTELKKAA